ncbi:MAG: transglutaminase-like domain-containing protein, partial [Candidatus Methanomethylicaceae archaeon]
MPKIAFYKKITSLILISVILMSNLQVALAYSFSENELPHRPIYPLYKEVDTENIVTPSYIAQTGFSPEDLSPITVGGHYDPKSILNEITPTPLNIYLYLRNNFNFEPYYGFLKGPSLTNLDKSGNDLDLAVLLVYLLRSASYPAKYVYGTITLPSDKVINWLGVNTTDAALSLLKAAGIPSRLTVTNEGIASIELEHFWVEVYYEGKWYALDPSFKEYVYYQPESIVEDWLNGSKIVKDLIDNTNFDGYYIKMAQPSIFTSPDLNSSNIISAVNGTTGF